MPITFCKNIAGKIFPAWESANEKFSWPILNRNEYIQLCKEINERNINMLEDIEAILIDEIRGLQKIEKKELPHEFHKYMKTFPVKFQL